MQLDQAGQVGGWCWGILGCSDFRIQYCRKMVLKSSSIIEVNLIYIISLSVAMDILSPRIQHIVLEEDI